MTLKRRLNLFTFMIGLSICPLPFLQTIRSIHLYLYPQKRFLRDLIMFILFECVCLCMICACTRSYAFYREIHFAYNSLKMKSNGWTKFITDPPIVRERGLSSFNFSFFHNPFQMGQKNHEKFQLIKIISPIWILFFILAVIQYIWIDFN